MLRRIFLGLPRQDLIRYTTVLQTIEPAQLEETDSLRLQEELNRCLLSKLLGVPSALLVSYYLPVSPVWPKLAKTMMGLLVYRVVTIPQSDRALQVVKQVCDKYSF